MMAGALRFSILHLPRCKIQSLPSFQSANKGCLTNNFVLGHSPRGYSGIKFVRSNAYDPLACHLSQIIQPTSTTNGQRVRDTEESERSNLRNEILDGKVQSSIVSNSVTSRFGSIQYHDGKHRSLESQDSKHHVRVFAFDIETTGFCRVKDRIIEIAIRDLSGGKGSCFQTLVNPEEHVPNSHIHGIRTDMVNQPDVPRMEDLIPILVQYIRSRLVPGEVALFVAHNARCFDVPFLRNEFSRCFMETPSDWRFLDTLPLGREYLKSNGSKASQKSSLQGLCKCMKIPVEGSIHRAMSDVNLLTSVLERLTFEMKLTTADLLKKSFRASDTVKLKKIKSKS